MNGVRFGDPVEDDLVEPGAAIHVQSCPHLVRVAARGVRSNNPVVYQSVDARPVLGRIRIAKSRLVQHRAPHAHVRAMVLAAQDESQRPPYRVARRARIVADSRVDYTAAPERPLPPAALRRIEAPAHERRGRRAGDDDAVGAGAGQFEHFRTGRGKHDGHRAGRADEPPPGNAKRLPLEIHGLAAEQRPANIDRFAQRGERPRAFDSGGRQIRGSSGAERQDDPPRMHLVERCRRHRGMHGMHRIGADRHQRDPEGPRGRQRRRCQRDRIAQEEMGCDPERLRAAGFGGLRLLRDVAGRREAVDGDSEVSHDSHRRRRASAGPLRGPAPPPGRPPAELRPRRNP